MEFYINGNKVEVSLENEKTVGEVLNSFARECENNQAAVYAIKLNDKNISAEEIESVSANELTGNEKFDFTVVTRDGVSESFKLLAQDLSMLAEGMEEVPNLFMNGMVNEANEKIEKLADSIDQFVHITTISSLFPETFGSLKIGEMSFSDFFNDFSPILSDFENALASNDTVLTGDLCEYEICPRLREMASSLMNA